MFFSRKPWLSAVFPSPFMDTSSGVSIFSSETVPNRGGIFRFHFSFRASVDLHGFARSSVTTCPCVSSNRHADYPFPAPSRTRFSGVSCRMRFMPFCPFSCRKECRGNNLASTHTVLPVPAAAALSCPAEQDSGSSESYLNGLGILSQRDPALNHIPYTYRGCHFWQKG